MMIILKVTKKPGLHRFSENTFLEKPLVGPRNLFRVKGAATDMRYFVRSGFSRSLVHKKNFSLIRQVVFKLGYLFCQER